MILDRVTLGTNRPLPQRPAQPVARLEAQQDSFEFSASEPLTTQWQEVSRRLGAEDFAHDLQRLLPGTHSHYRLERYKDDRGEKLEFQTKQNGLTAYTSRSCFGGVANEHRGLTYSAAHCQNPPKALEKALDQLFQQNLSQHLAGTAQFFGLQGEPEKLFVNVACGPDGRPGTGLLRWSQDGYRLRSQGPGSHSISMELKPNELSPSGPIAAGLKKVGVEPEAFLQVLEGTGLAAESVEAELVIKEGKERMVLTMALLAEDGSKAGLISRHFLRNEAGQLEVYHDTFRLNDSVQGHGLARLVQKNSFQLYDQLGVSKVRLSAASAVGGYAWARYGWELTPRGMTELRKQIPQDSGVVGQLLQSGDPKLVWALADMQAGKDLLLGTHWEGVLDLSDKTARRRLDNYLESAGAFPMDSYLVMRRAGIGRTEALEALGLSERNLSFVQRAALEVDPNDQAALQKLGVAA